MQNGLIISIQEDEIIFFGASFSGMLLHDDSTRDCCHWLIGKGLRWPLLWCLSGCIPVSVDRVMYHEWNCVGERIARWVVRTMATWWQLVIDVWKWVEFLILLLTHIHKLIRAGADRLNYHGPMLVNDLSDCQSWYITVTDVKSLFFEAMGWFQQTSNDPTMVVSVAASRTNHTRPSWQNASHTMGWCSSTTALLANHDTSR